MTAKLRTRLTAARDNLAKALASTSEETEKLAALASSRASIASQIDQLELATERDPEDEASVARFSTLREQARLLDRKIAKLESERAAKFDENSVALGNALSQAMEVLIEAASPLLRKLSEQATAAMAPFFKPGAKLEVTATRCDAILSLKAFLVNAGSGPEHEKPARVLALLDRLIAEEPLGWTWPGLFPEPATPLVEKLVEA